MLENIITDAGKMVVNLIIGIADDGTPTGMEIIRPNGIIFHRIWLIMLRTIQFDDQF